MSVAYDWTDGAVRYRRRLAGEVYCTEIGFLGLRHLDGDQKTATWQKLLLTN